MSGNSKRRLVVFALSAAALAGCRSSGDRLHVPTPGPENYRSLNPAALHAVSPKEIYVVGHLACLDGTPEGLILSSETGGESWRRHAVEVHDLRRVTFQCVTYADRLNGWVGGIRTDAEGRTRPTVFRTEDGGNRWREFRLPQDPGLLALQVHDLVFTSEADGAVGVTFAETPGGPEKESYFVTQDGGRSWVAKSYREAPKAPVYDQTVSFIDEMRGFRIVPTTAPGVTRLEVTGSGGKDWMPVQDLQVADLATYY